MRLVALVTALVLAFAAPAGAQQPDLTWCGQPAPAFTFDSLLPGGSDTVQLTLCNQGNRSGTVAFWIDGADPALAAAFNIDIDGRWIGKLTDLIDPVIDSVTLLPGGQRTYVLRLELDKAVTNELANKKIDFRVVVTLTDAGGGGGGGGAAVIPGRPTTTTTVPGTTSTTRPTTATTDGGGAGGSTTTTTDGTEVLGEVIVRVPVEVGGSLPGGGGGSLVRTGMEVVTWLASAGALIVGGSWIANLAKRRRGEV
ncbi:MAG TPA: hypothetical protein VIR30_09395 [Nocardioides sp.]